MNTAPVVFTPALSACHIGGNVPPSKPPATSYPPDDLRPPGGHSRFRFIGVTVKLDTFLKRIVKRDRSADPPHPKWNESRERWDTQLRFPWANDN